MSFFDIFKQKAPKNPEDDFTIIITELYVRVEHPQATTSEIQWSDIQLIKLVNTDQGPWLPDIWLILMGNEMNCVIPHGAKNFDEVIERISKYEGFDNDAIGRSMCCTENAEFVLWAKGK
jgi:hypothetical protein